MGRIRTVKPDFFVHEGLYDLELETELPIRIGFCGLWTCCDREGRFQWRPRTLKAAILPFDELDFSRVLDALASHGFVLKYESEGKPYGYVPSWKRHQVINNRESASKIPPFPLEDHHQLSQPSDGSLMRASRVNDETTTGEEYAEVEGKGREGKGREGSEEAPPASLNEFHPIQYGVRILEGLKVPRTQANNRAAGAAMEAIAPDHPTLEKAYECLLARALAHQSEGVNIDKFYFEDAKYKRSTKAEEAAAQQKAGSSEFDEVLKLVSRGVA